MCKVLSFKHSAYMSKMDECIVFVLLRLAYVMKKPQQKVHLKQLHLTYVLKSTSKKFILNRFRLAYVLKKPQEKIHLKQIAFTVRSEETFA